MEVSFLQLCQRCQIMLERSGVQRSQMFLPSEQTCQCAQFFSGSGMWLSSLTITTEEDLPLHVHWRYWVKLAFVCLSFSFGIKTPPTLCHTLGTVPFCHTVFMSLCRNVWFLLVRWDGAPFGPSTEATTLSTSVLVGRLILTGVQAGLLMGWSITVQEYNPRYF